MKKIIYWFNDLFGSQGGDGSNNNRKPREDIIKYWVKYTSECTARGIPFSLVQEKLKVETSERKLDVSGHYDSQIRGLTESKKNAQAELTLLEDHPDVFIEQRKDHPSQKHRKKMLNLKAAKAQIEETIKTLIDEKIKLQNNIV
ncbi:hypothetical protein [Marinoscillum sp.]|uniref:hypothetical protein n=1 Tax=Marinoscillum sp. TaxID=2024838 RepID=UPI003BA9DEAA